jgi:quercetin dioxygenase-like cupin family protein
MPDDDYPEIIQQLPDVDVPLAGVRGKLLQGEHNQLVFFAIDAGAEVPLHHHGAQWGIVVEGELRLSIDGEVRSYLPGDTYVIPAGVEHGAVFETPVKVIDFFGEPDRYRARSD